MSTCPYHGPQLSARCAPCTIARIRADRILATVNLDGEWAAVNYGIEHGAQYDEQWISSGPPDVVNR